MTGPQPPFNFFSNLHQQLDIDLVLQAAELGVWEVDPVTNQVRWDARCGQLFGLDTTSTSYPDSLRHIHPEDVERVSQAVQWALNPQSDGTYQATYRSIGQDGRTRWIRSMGKSYFDQRGQPVRFAGVAQELTQQIEAQQQEALALQQSEARFRTLIEEAPVATCLFVGPDMRIELANQAMIRVWGKGPAVIGLPLAEALPELKQQHFLTTLDELFTTGNSYQAKGGRADLVVDGQLQTFYFDYDFKPLRTPQGEVYAILEMAQDVTQQVMARQQLEDLQVHLQEAIELAQLGIWSIDVATNELSFSDRLIEWFGYDPDEQDYQQVIPILDAADQERVNQAVAWALNPQSDGVYNEIYTVIHPQTGQKRILHARGKTVFDVNGQPVRLNGTAQDITLQRELQLALEQQVQLQTEQLAAANEELAAINEELTATNEELMAGNEEYTATNEALNESTQQLIRSNDSLQRFAYVASHDLQEPLRKIRQFGDLLKEHYGPQLGEGVGYLERMQSAAGRMSTLIKDLLDYSRLSTQPESSASVSLAEVVNGVLTTLELAITETGAKVQVASLPTIQGDALQLSQLFQNLLANALKFHRPGVPPLVHIRARWLAADHLPPGVNPLRSAVAYHQIEVADNGIGFEEKYLDRIFNVFQRLHGKNQYAGTGIGLAICEKVVTNHGGAITASSQPGQGATFSVYLPV